MAQQRRAWRGWTAALAAGLALAGCGRSRPFPTAASPAPTQAADPGYRGPPQLTGMIRAADGSLSLVGRAMASSHVRLASPVGALQETVADGKGAWRAALGPVSEPALYGLSAEADGRRVQAEGYVAVLPSAPEVALLRAGAGAELLDGGGATPRIQAIDFDGSGNAVVSGRAAPSSPLRVLVDGTAVMDGAAGGDGRFSLTLPKPLVQGERRIQVMAPKAVDGVLVQISSAQPLAADGPYRATAIKTGWRIDWLTPGGGAQSTLLLAPAGPTG